MTRTLAAPLLLLALALPVSAGTSQPAETPALEGQALEDAELANAVADEPGYTADPAAVLCPEGADNVDGHCLEAVAAAGLPRGSPGAGSRDAGRRGAGQGGAPAVFGLFLIAAALLALRRAPRGRRFFPALVFAAACATLPESWDDAASEDPPADAAGRYLDVSAAESLAGSAPALVLDQQRVAQGRFGAPEARFSLARAPFPGSLAVRRGVGACGDRLVLARGEGVELLGYAAGRAEDGTAPLVQLISPAGCAELATDPDAIAALLAQGYSRDLTLGRVWPPGWGDGLAPAASERGSEPPSAAAEDAAGAPAPCKLAAHPALVLLYSGAGSGRNDAFLKGCPGEVVLGEKTSTGPVSQFRGPTAHAAGARTAYIYSDFGNEILDLLDLGTAHAVAAVKARLAAGYDYVVIDEITTNPRWADASVTSTRFRQMLLQLPPRKVIAYVSLDLTMKPGGDSALRARRLLLRALKLRARVLAYELYLHTGQVMAGGAPAAFRTAAFRVALAVKGLAGAAGINARAISVLGVSVHSKWSQYEYLDDPRHDLASLHRQGAALRHASESTRRQHGIGFYWSGASSIEPRADYTLDQLVAQLHAETLRFK